MLKYFIHKILCSIGFHSFAIKSFYAIPIINTGVKYECKYCTKETIKYKLFNLIQAINQKEIFLRNHYLQRTVLTEKIKEYTHMVCPLTGQVDLKYNPEIMTQDYFIPLR